MLHDSLLDASLLFFAVWTLAVGAISITAFGSDLLPFKVRVESRSSAFSENQPQKSPFSDN